jgi:hypothetical protein
MGFLDKLARLLGLSGSAGRDFYQASVRCNRCGEVVPVRVDLRNDLSINYGEDGGPTTYECRKLVSGDGSNLCFQKMELFLQFDENRRLLNREVTGGTFVDPQDS